MFRWFDKPKRHVALINDQPVTVEPGETLLKAALRQGIDYPHHCGVGGCGVCKCRLLDGKVEEMTDSSYVLSEAELKGGYILACQSLLRTEVSVTVDRCVAGTGSPAPPSSPVPPPSAHGRGPRT